MTGEPSRGSSDAASATMPPRRSRIGYYPPCFKGLIKRPHTAVVDYPYFAVLRDARPDGPCVIVSGGVPMTASRVPPVSEEDSGERTFGAAVKRGWGA